MKPLIFHGLPAIVANASGTVTTNESGWQEVTVTFSLSGEGLKSGTDVVIVLDASFSMWAGFYRNPDKVIGLVEPVIDFMSPYDDDGIDVYLHSLNKQPFQRLGAEDEAFTSGGDVIGHISHFSEMATARKEMGMGTFGAPVIHDIVARFKERKGTDRLFIEMITDGIFHDADDLKQAILRYGMQYNDEENPFGIRFHFTGIGPQGALGVEFLRTLDEDLESQNPGYIDCVQADHADKVATAVQSIVRELQESVKLEAEGAIVEFVGDDGSEPAYVAEGSNAWEEQPVLSLEALPVTLTLRALYQTMPREVHFKLQFSDGDGNDHTLLIRASAG